MLLHAIRWEGTGESAKRVVEPLSTEKLKSIRELVVGATGLQEDRGDQLIVESLPFESTLNWKPPEEIPAAPPSSAIPIPAWLQNTLEEKNMLVLGAIAGSALLVLFLLMVFVFLAMRRKRRSVKVVSTGKALPGGEQGVPELPEGPSMADQMQERLSEQAALKAQLEAEALRSLKIPKVKTKKAEVMTKQLRTAISCG